MAIFGGRKNLLQRVEEARWRNDEERDATLQEFRGSGTSATDALPLIFHADASVRQVAIELFRAGATATAAMALAKSMDSKTSGQRTAAGRVFGQLQPEVVTPVVDRLLAEKGARQQRLGWEIALSLTGPAGSRYLSRAVTDAPISLRAPALRRLLQVAQPDQMVDVLLHAATAEDARMTAPALEALSRVDDPRVMDLMLELFQSPDAAVREHAQQYLGRAAQRQPKLLRARMLELLAEGEDATRRACIEVLLASGDPTEVLTQLFEFMHELLGWIRTRIVHTLQTFGERLLDPTLALLLHPNEDVRTTALMVAESFNDPRLVGPLCRMLRDPDWWLKVSACDSLGALGDARAVPFLVQSLADEDCCWAAVEALGRIGDPDAAPLLRRWAKSQDVALRAEAVVGLGSIPTVAAKETVLDALADPSERVRIAALQGVLRVHGADVIEALEPLCADPLVSVRLGVAQMQGRSQNPAATDVAVRLCEDPVDEVRTEALLALLALGDGGALKEFNRLMENQPEPIQASLRDLEDEHPARKATRRILETSNRSTARRVALRALGFLGRIPVDTLVTALRDPDPQVRVAALEIGSDYRDDEVTQAMERMVDDPDPEVRDAFRRQRIFVVGEQ